MKFTPDIVSYTIMSQWQHNELLKVLVRKVYGDKSKRHKSRNWKLQQLNKEVEEEMDTENYDR